MNWLDWIIGSFVIWPLGSICVSLFLTQFLILAFFDIPLTIRLIRKKILTDKKTLISSLCSMIIQIVLFSLVFWGMLTWGTKYLLFYYIGIGIGLFIIISKLPVVIHNPANIKEYFDGLARSTGNEKFKTMNLDILNQKS